MRYRTTFDELALHPRKSGKCFKCGKRTTRTVKIYQTENPYNRHPDGTVKSRADIWKAVQAECDEWMKRPITCTQCESTR